jgi:AcrR family transcriptional regulator
MPPVQKSLTPRKLRADGLRNKDQIIRAAKAAFTLKGPGASLDDIAKKAGVGAGTLYRHFPNRELLLAAVYRAEVEKLAEAADKFSQELPPVDAIRAWLQLFIEHLATKKVIATALDSLVGGSQALEADKPKVHAAVSSLYNRAILTGDFRPDVVPLDHLLAIVGVTFFGQGEDGKEAALRLAEILIRGSRPSSDER